MGIATKFYLNSVDMYETYGVGIGKVDGNGFWVEDFIPPNEDISQSVVGKDGAYFYKKVLKPREREIPCYIDGLTETQKNTLQQALYIKTPQKLSFNDVDPIYKYINIVSNGLSEWNVIQYSDGLYRGYFNYKVIAYDPVWYSTTPLVGALKYNTGLTYNSGLKYNDYNNPNYQNNITTTRNFTLANNGSYNAKMKVILIGNGTNISITNNTTGKSFTISSMNSEQVVIDGLKGQINDGGSILKTSIFSGYFIEVVPGNNSMSITGTGLNLSAKFDYLYTYI
jgi:phage-related protein